MSRTKNKKILAIALVLLNLILIGTVIFLLINYFGGKEEPIDNHNSEVQVNDENIIGVWRFSDIVLYGFDGENGYLQIEDDKLDFSYTAKNGTVYIDFSEDYMKDCEYDYTVSENQLKLIGKDGTTGGEFVLTKENTF